MAYTGKDIYDQAENTIYVGTGSELIPLAETVTHVPGDYVQVSGDKLRDTLNALYAENPFGPVQVFIPRLSSAAVADAVENSAQFSFYGGEIVVDPPSFQVFFNEKPVEVTPKEFSLISILGRKPGIVITRETLMQNTWGKVSAGKSLNVHIKRIREKTTPAAILTRRGIGFVAAK